MRYTALRGENDYQTDVQPSPQSPPPHPRAFLLFTFHPHHLAPSLSLPRSAPRRPPFTPHALSLSPISLPRSVPRRISLPLPHPRLPIRTSAVVNQQLRRREQGVSLGKVVLVFGGAAVGAAWLHQHHRQLPLESWSANMT